VSPRAVIRTVRMGRLRWDHPDDFDDVLLLAAADGPARRALRDRLARVAGRERSRTLGRYPRYRVVLAASGAEARRRAGPSVTVAAVDLAVPGGPGLEVIRQLRSARPALAILAFGLSTDASDAIASLMSGADFFHEFATSPDGIDRALELAIDRRRLTHEIERTETEMEQARGRLAQLSGELVQAVPGFRPLSSREDVLPFREAARRYLLAATKLFPGDPRGLARALGVSYFALRRLLARYDVPFPAVRPRR
jgi:DNA-binding NarL/FixJ family response regulator